MENSNYLIDFSHKLDCIISQINKLNSKIRLYQKNSEIFGMNFYVQLNISPDYFLKLRDFLHKKIEEGSNYDKRIVDLKRNFAREYSYLMIKIGKEIKRIENTQETQMNSIVYNQIYKLKWENEIYLRDQYNVENSFFDYILGKGKFRKLSYINHDLKAELIKKEYAEKKNEHRSLFELINMIENVDIKDGNLLCLKDEMIKYFMIDKNNINKNYENAWKQAKIVPIGLCKKRAYYRKISKELYKENKKLQVILNDNSRLKITYDNNFSKSYKT